MSKAHALLSASGSSRWLNCPPSVRLEENEPNTTSVYAEEGTLAHNIGELMLMYADKQITKRTYNTRLNKFKKDDLFENSMLEHCEKYVTVVMEKYAEALNVSSDAQLIIEKKLDYSDWAEDGFGTVDALIVSDGMIEIIDFKYGKGVEVSAVKNTQMAMYGLGAFNEFDMLYGIEKVNFTIAQPRLNNISSSSMSRDSLLNFGEYVKERAKLAYNGDGEFCVGEHCRFCKVQCKCKAYAEEQLEVLDYDFKETNFLNASEISSILMVADKVKKWLDNVTKYALTEALNGNATYDGFKLVEGRSSRKFSNVDDVIETLINNDVEEALIYKPKELISLTAMEKLLGKEQFSSMLNSLVIKPPGKPVLVSIDDKRQALSSAANDFKGE